MEHLLFSMEIVDQDPVASYSMFPVDLICNGHISNTAMSMTTMTHPDWRGKGLFPKLAVELYDYAEAKQFKAVWGFPNANSHATFNSKLGWSDIYEIPTLTLNLESLNVKNIHTIVQVDRDDQFSCNYAPPLNDGLTRVNRTREYLIWRYARNPTNRYSNYVINRDGQISSYLVVKRFRHEIDLVDIQAVNPDEARALLLTVARESNANKIVKLNCWAPTHHFIHAVLEKIGFVNDSPVTYFGGRILESSGLPAELLDYRKWYVQMGDSDVF
jgi:hypothetical protein